MIDTLQFGVKKDFEISKSNRLIKRTDLNQETGEISEKFYFNNDILNLTIDFKGLSVKTNLSKLYGLGDNNFYPLGANSFEIAIDTLERAFDDIGIVADLDKAEIWRLDLFKNVLTSKPYGAYKDVLQGLNLKRTQSRQYPDGYLVKNGLRELIFYNKVKELKEKLGFAYVRQLGFENENVVRGELRLLKHKEVKKYGIEYLKDIPNKWEDLKKVYRSYMKEVFKYEFQGGGESLKVETLKALISNAMISLILEGKWALQYYGYYPYSFVNRDELLNALLNHFSRAQSFRILAEIEKFKKNSLARDTDYKRLYDELKEKFLEEGRD
jgi:hypothetical protein